MGSSTVIFSVAVWIQIASPEITRKEVLFEDPNLLEGGSKSFFFLSTCQALQLLLNTKIALFLNLQVISSNSWLIGVFEQMHAYPLCCNICHYAAVYSLKPPYYNTCADFKGGRGFSKGGKSPPSLPLYESLSFPKMY